MKKTIGLLLGVALIASCTTKKETFNVHFKIPGFEGNLLKINKFVESDFVVIDSVVIDSLGDNTLTGSVDHPELMYLTIDGQRRPMRLFVENVEYTVTGTWNESNIETSGPVQNELTRYEDGLNVHRKRMSELYDEYRAANQENNEEKIDSLIVYLEETDARINAYDSIFILENPASFVSVMALRNIFYRFDADGLEHMLSLLDERVHSMEEYGYMANKLDKMKKVAIGQPFTDFGLETPDGEILNVSDVHNNNVLLVDFWAAWCGPCRRANPEIVALYNTYHEQGFDVIGVSLDRDRESWLNAIEADKLTWHHISDLKYWQSAGAELYGVSSIPHSVLIDKNGIIRAKNLMGEALSAKVEELLNE